MAAKKDKPYGNHVPFHLLVKRSKELNRLVAKRRKQPQKQGGPPPGWGK